MARQEKRFLDAHRDPFDRPLVAQAQLEGIPLITADPAFDGYDVEVISAAGAAPRCLS